MKENYYNLINPKFKKIHSSLFQLKDNNSLKKEIQTLKNNNKLFSKYYFIYEQSDTIIKKYEGDDLSELPEDEIEYFIKIKKHIKFLNDIKIKEIYENLKSQEYEDEDKNENEIEDIENINNNEQKLGNIEVVELINHNEFYERRKKELEDLNLKAKKLRDIKQDLDLRLKEKKEELENNENNENDEEKSEKSEVLIKENKEGNENSG